VVAVGLRTLRDLPVAGKRVLVRVDFNVPLAPDGRVLDDTRLRAVLPTIEFLRRQGARIILVSHLGRPKGRDPQFSLRPVAEHLSRLLGRPVQFAPDCIGPAVEAMVARLQPGEMLLLENVRFYPEEERNDPDFARALARLAEVFVNDAFAAAHRAHASTVGVAAYLPAAAGLLMEKEVTTLREVLEQPARPFVAIVGGAKISTKIGVLQNLLPRVDRLLIGGAMAFTLLKARGCQVGASLVEEDKLAVARSLLQQGGEKIVLPVDVVAAPRLEPNPPTQVVDACRIPEGWLGLDIGPATVNAWAPILAAARTILWNGPLGAYEVPPFDAGTRAIGQIVAQSGARSIVGGGDLVAALEQAGLADKMSFVSTGGGATLEFLEGRTLPGIQVLMTDP
jgi:phosphoglycerate kinase